jgi:hypothetical protein
MLIGQKTGRKQRLRDSFHAMISWAEKGGRVSSRRVARVIGTPVGIDEKETKAILGSLAAMIKGWKANQGRGKRSHRVLRRIVYDERSAT